MSKGPWSAPAGDANGGTSGWDEDPIEPGRPLTVHDGFDTPSPVALRVRSDETAGHHFAQSYRWDEQPIDPSRWLSMDDGFDTTTGGTGFVDVAQADAAVEQNPDDPWTRSADWSPDAPMRRAEAGTDAWPLENRADVSRGALPDALLRWPEDLAGRWPELPEDRSRADARSAEELVRASERLRHLDAEQRGTRWNA